MEYYVFYINQGFTHISDINAYDHILFLVSIAAVYSFKKWKEITILITGFTLGHSLALVMATLEIVKLNSTFVEFLIPVTILLSCIVGLNKIKNEESLSSKSDVSIDNKFHVEHSLKIKLTIITLFGLIHGLGFSNYLRFILTKDENIFGPLLAFNIGLEIGQLLILFAVLIINFVFLCLQHLF